MMYVFAKFKSISNFLFLFYSGSDTVIKQKICMKSWFFIGKSRKYAAFSVMAWNLSSSIWCREGGGRVFSWLILIKIQFIINIKDTQRSRQIFVLRKEWRKEMFPASSSIWRALTWIKLEPVGFNKKLEGDEGNSLGKNNKYDKLMFAPRRWQSYMYIFSKAKATR